jgi:hypothetical protein
MVLKTSGPPLHTTCPAYNKKDQIFPKIIQKLQKKFQVKAGGISSGRAVCFLATSDTTNLSNPHSLSRSFYGKTRITNKNTTLFWDWSRVRYVPRYRRNLAPPYSTVKTETAGTQKHSSNGRGNHKSHMDYHVHNNPATDPYLEQQLIRTKLSHPASMMHFIIVLLASTQTPAIISVMWAVGFN